MVLPMTAIHDKGDTCISTNCLLRYSTLCCNIQIMLMLSSRVVTVWCASADSHYSSTPIHIAPIDPWPGPPAHVPRALQATTRPSIYNWWWRPWTLSEAISQGIVVGVSDSLVTKADKMKDCYILNVQTFPQRCRWCQWGPTLHVTIPIWNCWPSNFDSSD